MRERVGGFFRNTQWLPQRTCEVCAGPVSGFERCYRCKFARDEWGSQLADVVMPLTYAYRYSDEHRASAGRHQSEQHMWSYKAPQPGPGCVTDLAVMLFVALQWHRSCAEARVGIPWTSWAVVPSSRRERVGHHPLGQLGATVGLTQPGSGIALDWVQLVAAGLPSADRDVRADRFAVCNQAEVVGRHVLVLEDTWVTGASLQSAAVTLKQAGAAAVSVLCLARWLREDGPADASGFFASLATPYDALSCPVNAGRICAGPYRM